MKAAIVGVGRMGNRHAEILRQCGLELAALCDVKPEACAAAGHEFGVAPEYQYEDADMMIASVRPDLVIVSTTAPSHHDIVRKAATMGASFVLCEKPMATCVAACDDMIVASSQSGARLAVNHQMRFMEQYARPKEIANSEELGGLRSVMVSAGNFGLAMNGTHYFEMFRYMTDEAPRSISAWLTPEDTPNPRGAQFKDAAGSVRMMTASGKRFYLDCSADQGHGLSVVYACRYGQIIVDELVGRMCVTYREPKFRDAPSTRYAMPHVREEIAIKPADAIAPSRSVLEALLAGAGYPTGEEGRLAMELLIAAHESAERGGENVDREEMSVARDRHLPIA